MKIKSNTYKAPVDKVKLKAQLSKLLKKTAITLTASIAISLLMATVALAEDSQDTLQTLLKGDSESLKIIVTLHGNNRNASMLIMLTGFNTHIDSKMSILRTQDGLANMPPNMVIL
jgi:flagellar biosynthesis protein FliP